MLSYQRRGLIKSTMRANVTPGQSTYSPFITPGAPGCSSGVGETIGGAGASHTWCDQPVRGVHLCLIGLRCSEGTGPPWSRVSEVHQLSKETLEPLQRMFSEYLFQWFNLSLHYCFCQTTHLYMMSFQTFIKDIHWTVLRKFHDCWPPDTLTLP